MWLFNSNKYGDVRVWETTADGQRRAAMVGKEYSTRTDIVTPYVKMQFNAGMLVVWAVLHGLVLGGLWGLWGWGICGRRGAERKGEESGKREANMEMPAISSFPIFDVGFKTEVVKRVDDETKETGKDAQGGLVRRKTWEADDGDVVRLMRGWTVRAKKED